MRNFDNYDQLTDNEGNLLQGGLLQVFNPIYNVEERRKKEKEEQEKAEEREEMQGYIFPFESEESEGL